jgi:hypothetical protein
MKPILKSLRSAAFAALMLSPAAAFASDTPTTVVELFTSQGCSSCPPANEFVGKLSEDPEKLVLTYGVTYWDYLGWKDTFGNPKFTKRQRAYGQAFGAGNVYTPQIVLNGSAHSPRYTKRDVETMALKESPVPVKLMEKEGKLVLDTRADAVVVTFKPGTQSVPVKAGENHGRTLKISNVVMGVETIKAGEALDIAVEPGYAYAALIHDPETLKVVNASVYRP